MKIQDATKQGLILSGNSGTVGDDTYKKLTENCFAVLLKGPEVHGKFCRLLQVSVPSVVYWVTDIESTTRDVIQEVYAALLTIAAEFGRNDYSKESVLQYLIDECKYDRNRAEYFADTYDHNKLKLQVVLGNIGTHLPHIVDANWKIDYVVKVRTEFAKYNNQKLTFALVQQYLTIWWSFVPNIIVNWSVRPWETNEQTGKCQFYVQQRWATRFSVQAARLYKTL